jgi:hypothetical protein
MEPRSRPGGRPVLRRQPNDRNFVLLQQDRHPMLAFMGFRGCKGLQPSSSLSERCWQQSFQGGMASVPSHFSPCYKG